jgi:hypothetical protein
MVGYNMGQFLGLRFDGKKLRVLVLRACLEIEILREFDEKDTAPSPCCVSKTRMEPHPWMGEIIPAI